MFSKKTPEKKLRTQYETLMKEAMTAQRGGDIVKSSELHAQAEAVLKQLDDLKSNPTT
ncbi:MAG: Lacal_2735 family protein [Verrucomicrobia bacterium]|nr:Lacal_2735 family protein [Verrucomicrobiota bacterium]